jgi:hypothetical protein
MDDRNFKLVWWEDESDDRPSVAYAASYSCDCGILTFYCEVKPILLSSKMKFIVK